MIRLAWRQFTCTLPSRFQIKVRMAVIIRPMTLEDIPQVHAIDVLSFSLPWPERSYQFELTKNPSTRLWVAELISAEHPLGSSEQPSGTAGESLSDEKHQIVGMLVMWHIIDEAHIGTFAVHPDYRRRGIGRKLLAYALLKAARRGMRRVFLEVRASNLAAQELYRQFGFQVDGVRPRYYSDKNEDALLMSLEPVDLESLQRLVQSFEDSPHFSEGEDSE